MQELRNITIPYPLDRSLGMAKYSVLEQCFINVATSNAHEMIPTVVAAWLEAWRVTSRSSCC